MTIVPLTMTPQSKCFAIIAASSQCMIELHFTS